MQPDGMKKNEEENRENDGKRGRREEGRMKCMGVASMMMGREWREGTEGGRRRIRRG
jgi:hypothetical protein